MAIRTIAGVWLAGPRVASTFVRRTPLPPACSGVPGADSAAGPLGVAAAGSRARADSASACGLHAGEPCRGAVHLSRDGM
jgi:hypothetical protein